MLEGDIGECIFCKIGIAKETEHFKWLSCDKDIDNELICFECKAKIIRV